MSTLTVPQIGLLMAAVGWLPPMGYTQHSDGSIEVTDPQAKAKAIAFFDRAVAVCLAESGGNTLAKNGNSSASGLWQIMASVHTDLIAKNAKWIQSELELKRTPNVFHPLVNTACAHDLYAQSGWGPWKSSAEGQRKYLGKGYGKRVWETLTSPKVLAQQDQLLTSNLIHDAATAEAATFVVPGATLVNNDLIKNPLAWIDKLIDFLKKAGVPVGVFVLGLILIILGVVFVVSQSKAAKAAVKLIP